MTAGHLEEMALHELGAPVRKASGEPKEIHEARLAAASTVLDVHAYVDDFNSSVVEAYRRGVADAELPSETGVARSIIPPGTAATRDFSGLAPQIPDFVLDACVGCMTCVNACPDTAILGIAQPTSVVDEAIGAFAASPAGLPARRDDRAFPFRHDHEVRRRSGQARPRAGPVRDLRRPRPLQGLRRVRPGLPRARL